MDFTSVDPIARALLYKGCLLYPYRNCRQCAFGSLFAQAYCQANGDIEPWSMQIECLVRAGSAAAVQGTVRFLGEGGSECQVELGERSLDQIADQPEQTVFSWDEPEDDKVIRDKATGCDENRKATLSPGRGTVVRSAQRLSPSVIKLRVRIENQTPAATSDHVMHSTHAILQVRDGCFLSLIDPPADAGQFAKVCQNRGAWPVLVGDRRRHDLVLAAPIILYDFPEIAPENPGDLFDGTEIDELLTLRIVTLTAAERAAMKGGGLHESCRGVEDSHPLRPGDRVCIHPVGRADLLDLALAGKSATVESCEQDFEGRIFCTVTLEDDPGQDLGRAGKPGHRFFFRREELCLIECNHD